MQSEQFNKDLINLDKRDYCLMSKFRRNNIRLQIENLNLDKMKCPFCPSYIQFFKKRSIFSLHFSEASTSGRRGLPQSKPILFIAYFTGIGLTSQNSAFVRGREYSCDAHAFCQFPVK